MRPEVMAKASNYVYYANGNKASKEFLEDDVIGDPAIYPPMIGLAPLHGLLPDKRARNASQPAWTEVKSGQ
jgi:putrescine transport system substrate-binding protein